MKRTVTAQQPVLRGLAMSMLAGGLLLVGAWIVAVSLTLHHFIAWTPTAFIPLAMSRLLQSRDDKFAHDFLHGCAWYFLALVLAFALVVFMRDGMPHVPTLAGLAVLPLASMMFAFGVLRRHTSLHDELTGGVLAGFSSLDHPQKRTLGLICFGGFPAGLLVGGAVYLAVGGW